MRPLKILFVSAEVAPFAKTGGLADVTAALPGALAAAGHDVRILVPLHRGVRTQAPDLVQDDAVAPFQLTHGDRSYDFALRQARLPGSGVPVHFLDCPALYDRPTLYTHDPDEHVRWAALARGALEAAQRWRWSPDVFHVHDWHAALLPLYLRTTYSWDRLFERSSTLLTIHNLGHQGEFGAAAALDLALGEAVSWLPQEDLAADRLNLLKTGIVYTDRLTTVSPTYAQEIQGPELGCGLDDLLRARADVLSGILNGIDDAVWNPHTDKHLPARYSPKSLYRKELNKEALLHRCGLVYAKGVPVFGLVSRLWPQKGIDLVLEPLAEVLEHKDARFVALGAGDPALQDALRAMQARFPGRVRYLGGFDEPMAHLIEAGSDLFLMPSRYEPCGLNQMYSQRYGTAPIVRRTGGLADTVTHFDPTTGEGTGFVFEHATADGVRWALGEALAAYADRAAWRKLMLNGMGRDFSWPSRAAEYGALYAAMAAARTAAEAVSV
jgi:starch synthase